MPVSPLLLNFTTNTLQMHFLLPSRSSGLNHHEPSIEAGSRGSVERCADRAIKTFNEFDPKAIKHELNMCNDYLRATDSRTQAAFLDGGKLNMPYIAGQTPTQEEVKEAVRDLFKLDFMMGDPAPENFKKTAEGKIVPVDFGLMFKRHLTDSIAPHIKIEIVHDYAKGGFECIPDALAGDYQNTINAMEKQLGDRSPSRRMNIPQLRRAGLF
ncbi:hypothetical protein SAMN04490186_6295 [Pseudomonas grimontii]|uniref:Uncharacterized protein n=1 Tax=Pseudomonas grimontii TaxID=129847 RepID=A0A1H1IVI1_9PSED|nr:hypothetical protein [Pseudomonas grimontii]TWR70174.1 hypothetical protein FIV39_02225 [Pseudomonas grimontii]SDR41712.1 hypothetical protein SAMN04490186_6295 [Pseudomonas grimontii]